MYLGLNGVFRLGAMNGHDDVWHALDLLFEGDGAAARPLVVAGVPRCGKTRFAYAALLRGLRAFGDANAVMTVSGRVMADELGNRVIREVGASSKARPVTTLSALAFGVIADSRATTGDPAPRLLNGAEQDALLRQVVAVHVGHVRSGDMCGTCLLLRDYFADDDWADTVVAEDSDRADATALAMFERGISSEFVAQLRDMLARINELGASFSGEETLIRTLRGLPRDTQRLELQWRLAFALRREYVESIARHYPGEYRLDASRLLVEGAAMLGRSAAAGRGGAVVLPALLVVDDFQDTTLAGLRFLEALSASGVRLVLIGNPDEAVQTFRGSYPEYLFARAQSGPLGARLYRLPEHDASDGGRADTRHGESRMRGHTYRDVIAARVSLSIPSPEDEPLPIAERAWKLPRYEGALPIARLAPDSPLPGDGSVATALYRSAREELDDVVWRIKRLHLDARVDWNDMAVIAHDNATVRTFGERLRHDGVPVRYSSVNRPLKDEPFVQGLFALIELARLRRQGIAGVAMPLAAIAAYVRTRVASLMGSPLVTTGSRPGEGRAARLEPVSSAMSALASLADIVMESAGDGTAPEPGGTEPGDPPSEGRLARLVASWNDLRASVEHDRARGQDRNDGVSVAIDDSRISETAAVGDDLPFGEDALYVMLVFDDASAPASEVLDAIDAVLGRDPQGRAFARLWRLVASVDDGLGRLTSEEPRYALAVAWDAAGVASAWQRTALSNTPEGRAANDRLDAAMRLFQIAEGAAAGQDIVSFMAQVRAMEIEADSLAHVGPVEQAVTLTTPAGAAGRHWCYVWLPALQQGVWPNLAERSTLFGGEDLADIMLRGTIPDHDRAGHDNRLSTVLSSEKKGLLVALTRADDVVTVSAVWNDDTVPSDFLFGYVPERFERQRDGVRFATVGAPPERHDGKVPDGPSGAAPDGGADTGSAERDGDHGGLDADPRGLVAAARVALARHGADSAQGMDAARALALLARHGLPSANPRRWNFVRTPAATAATEPSATETVEPSSHAPVAVLSPSSVDSIWACPVCWTIENRCAGPRAGSVSTSFGTLIHAVAQQGSEEGLDLPGYMADAAPQQRVDAIADRLMAIYGALRRDPSAAADPEQRFEATRRDRTAREVLTNIATYFANGHRDGYHSGNAKLFAVGTLDRVECERQFSARFGLDDILRRYNALPGVDPIGSGELLAMMGSLVGGWPEGMSEDLTIRLSGTIDRLEHRHLGDGTATVRLIDYKTGRARNARYMVNNLQLVCYQLGLAFSDAQPDTSTGSPRITQSDLFYVAEKDSPASFYGAEGAFQPPLFAGESLNADSFTPRSRLKAEAALDVPELPDMAPEGVSRHAWDQLLSLRGTQAVWALTMIARVFYAGAASRSMTLTAHPTPDHIKSCRLKPVCPACAGQISTVFEMRQS